MSDGKTDSGQEGALRLQLHDGLTIAVPRTLSSITCYVLLEQEEWFEKEINFLRGSLKPGMISVYVGANLGSLQPTHGAAGRTRRPRFSYGARSRSAGVF